MRIITLLLVLVCSCTRYVAAPAPKPAPKAEPPKPEVKNRAAEVCSLGAQHIARAQNPEADAKCSLWGGRGTVLPEEVDAVICIGPTWILHCEAPDNGAPKFTSVLEWPAPRGDAAASSAPSPVAKDGPKKK